MKNDVDPHDTLGMREWHGDKPGEVVTSLLMAVRVKDPCTARHCERMARYAVWLARSIKMPARKEELLRYCCLLHDIGKIGIADHILPKPGPLSMEERMMIELHPVFGADIVRNLRMFAKGVPMILYYLERFDGRGYPRGLKKEEIPFEARIMAVVDAFDAMTAGRPYREAMPMSYVVEELRRESGRQFDPRIVQQFLQLIETAWSWVSGPEKRMAA